MRSRQWTIALFVSVVAGCGGSTPPPRVGEAGSGGEAGAAGGAGWGGTGGLAEGGSGGNAGSGGRGGEGGSEARCGNGVPEGDEACDGADLAGNSCLTLGFDGGELGCTNCQLDISDCVRNERCDNGTDDDGDALIDCADPDCEERAPCPRCGDGEVNVEVEACDGEVVGVTCADYGHTLGELRCTASCEIDASDCKDPEDCRLPGDEDHDGLAECADPDCSTEFECPVCGNGVLQQGEGCDGAAGSSCNEHGFDGGTFNCASGCVADTSGCRNFVCGDGFIDGTERCDDSNAMNGDGCNSACQIEGDDCSAPVALVWDASSATWIWEGDTTGFYADHTPGCADTHGVPDAVASFTATAAGRYYVSVSAAFDTVLFAWDGTCGSGSSLGCMNANGDGEAEGFELDLQANQTVYFGVSGLANLPEGSSNRGPFRLTVVEVTCNDGVLEGLEQCEDGNTIAGDGCSPTCRWEGDTCADAVDLALFPRGPGGYQWSASTAQFTPDYTSTCFVPTAPRDGVARFEAPSTDRYGVFLYATYAAALYALDGQCGQGGTELDCSSGAGVQPAPGTALEGGFLELDLTAGQTIYLIVDGASLSDNQYGEFWLIVIPATACGDGLKGYDEGCDDGNLTSGDGCSSGCRLEGQREIEPNDTPLAASPLTVGTQSWGNLRGPPVVDADLWSFQAVAGTTYTLQTASKTDRSCTGNTPNTRLRLFDAAGGVVAENDDIGPANDCSRIVWTAPSSGSFYVEVTAQRLWGIPVTGASWFYLLYLDTP